MIGWYSENQRAASELLMATSYPHAATPQASTFVYSSENGEVEVTCVSVGEDHGCAWSDMQRVGPVGEFLRHGPMGERSSC